MNPIVDRSLLTWQTFCRVWAVPEAVSTLAYRALSRSVHPEAVLVRFHLTALLDGDPDIRERRLLAFGRRVLTPQKLLALVENAVGSGWLSRQDANFVEEKLLAHVDEHGHWLYLGAEPTIRLKEVWDAHRLSRV